MARDNSKDKTRKNTKYPTVGTVLKLHRKIVERCRMDTHNTQIHDSSKDNIIG